MNDRIIIYESFTMIGEMEVIGRYSLIFDPTTTWVLFRCLLSQTGAFFPKHKGIGVRFIPSSGGDRGYRAAIRQ